MAAFNTSEAWRSEPMKLEPRSDSTAYSPEAMTDTEALRAALDDLYDDYLAKHGADGYPQPMPHSWRVVRDYLATPEPSAETDAKAEAPSEDGASNRADVSDAVLQPAKHTPEPSAEADAAWTGCTDPDCPHKG
jgi:hypothetical protein